VTSSLFSVSSVFGQSFHPFQLDWCLPACVNDRCHSADNRFILLSLVESSTMYRRLWIGQVTVNAFMLEAEA
jgi:hypothetical protein